MRAAQAIHAAVYVKAMAGAAILTVALGSSTMAHADWLKAKGQFERSLNVSGSVDLSVRSGCGDVEVRNGSSNAVKISARIEIGHGFNGNAEQRVHAHPIVVVFKAEKRSGIVAQRHSRPGAIEKAGAKVIVLDEVQICVGQLALLSQK